MALKFLPQNQCTKHFLSQFIEIKNNKFLPPHLKRLAVNSLLPLLTHRRYNFINHSSQKRYLPFQCSISPAAVASKHKYICTVLKICCLSRTQINFQHLNCQFTVNAKIIFKIYTIINI